MNRRMPAPLVYLAMSAVDGFLFRLMATIFSVYLIVDVGLDPFQLVLMGTILEVAYLLLEVPTGVVADVVSRRASVIIGMFVSGAAFLMLGLVHSFWTAALSQVLWAMGAAFVSGADVAWITDEVGEGPARKLYLRGAQRYQAGALVGTLAAAGLATIFLGLPIMVSGIGYLGLGAALLVVMPEEHFRRPPREAGKRLHHSFRQTLREGVGTVRVHPFLLLILFVAALHGASTEGFDRLADLHFLRGIGLPAIGGLDRVVWFGIIDAGALLLEIGITEFVKRRVDLEGHRAAARALAVIDSFLIGGVVLFGLAGGFALALAAFWSVGMLRGVRESVYSAWINQGLDPRVRATINSMGSQSDAIGQAAGGPVLGLIAKIQSVVAAIVLSGLLRGPALALYARAIKRGTVGTVPPEEMEPLEIEENPGLPEPGDALEP